MDKQNQLATQSQLQSQILELLTSEDSKNLWLSIQKEKPFRALQENEMKAAVRTITATICAMTGVSIEQTMLQAFLQILMKFLKDNYPFLNKAEVVSAFEMNSAGQYDEHIESYGRLSVDYIGKVLKKYISWRRESVSEILEANRRVMSPLLENPKPVEPVTDADRKQMVETAYEMYKQATTASIIGSNLIYDYCEMFKVCEVGYYEQFIEQAVNKLTAYYFNRYSALERSPKEGERMEYFKKYEVFKSGLIDDSAEAEAVTKSKELALKVIFKNFVDTNHATIFA